MIFYIGLHMLHEAHRFDHSFISVNRLRKRKSGFHANRWIMDSGAFTEIFTHGEYRHPVEDYAREIERWRDNRDLEICVAQDYMCEPFILAKTGKSVARHQRHTIDRYVQLINYTDMPIMPVLQGYKLEDYVDHVNMYDYLLKPGMRVGVGSICKRNRNPEVIEDILSAIHETKPGLRLHGFGIKTTALQNKRVRDMLYSADSMAWSFDARRLPDGVGTKAANDWRYAKQFENKIQTLL